MNDYQDEVSLRDLYLIFKRGFWLIAAVAILAAVGAFLFATFSADTYEAEATVLVTPTPVRTGDDAGAAIISRTNVNYVTYESLAFSRRVLDRTAVAFGIPADDRDRFPERLELTANDTSSAQLIVGHTATADSASQAAELADIWAQETVAAVTQTMQAILEPIISNNTQTVTQFETDLRELEAEWRAFQNRNDTALLEAELASFTTRNAQASERLDSLERDLLSNQARQDALAEALNSVTGVTGSDLDADADAVTALLESRGLLSNQAAAELNAFMQDAGTDSQLVQLLLGLELQSLVGQAAGIQANIDATERQRAEYAAAAAERRAAIAELAQERTELERDLRVAEGLYTNSLNLEPVLTYVSDVLETNVRVLDEASVPMSPASGGRLLITVIAFVVGGLLATVFVFLRAAVMPEPTPVRLPAPEAV